MFSSVTLLGRLTRDVGELRFVGDKKTSVVDIGVAVDDGFGDKKKTVFVDVTLWGQQAGYADNYLKKGSLIHISGRLSMDQWNDKETGKKRTKIKVTAASIKGLDPRGDKPATAKKEEEFDMGDDTVPF